MEPSPKDEEWLSIAEQASKEMGGAKLATLVVRNLRGPLQVAAVRAPGFRVDAVLLTGGMAHSNRIVSRLHEYLEWIAPIKVYPGEDELQSLAEGVFRVLNGEEQPKKLRSQLRTSGLIKHRS